MRYFKNTTSAILEVLKGFRETYVGGYSDVKISKFESMANEMNSKYKSYKLILTVNRNENYPYHIIENSAGFYVSQEPK